MVPLFRFLSGNWFLTDLGGLMLCGVVTGLIG